MMIELALHILDIAENSTRAQADFVEITVKEDLDQDMLSLEIRDNGCGMDEITLARAMDPFYTTKKVRKVGLGLPMLAQAAQRTGGSFAIESKVGQGTRVHARFGHSHLDRQPLGDVPGAITALILGSPDVDFLYTHTKNDRIYTLDTREIRRELDGIPLNHREVLEAIRENIREGIRELDEEE
ncbi:MAG TPA: ATP-binding protein [Deltaproteobacteria bacterium]|nr:ATP-binding protein [Deltaproteobacteria bacterium]MDI9543817.1 ATP-binding protein [Pseudomonadota bacterium]HOD69922.1 ATP-binding protein [Deltaproteobacteria bacterium]HOE71438.1 ATP-binding protein [Deltaproteobacteria bacterium]HON60641.1 ATP-binding protein [Deltaproteobacteria bacterium]